MLSIKFLVGLAPPLERYLTFQAEYPIVHSLHTVMKDLLVVVMKRFLQSSAVDGKSTNDLLKGDVAKKENQLLLDKMNFGKEADTYLQNLSGRKKNVGQQSMRDSYVSVVQYLQKKLPLNSQLLKDNTCLSPHFKSFDWTVNSIGWFALQFPHLLSERDVSIVKDQ